VFDGDGIWVAYNRSEPGDSTLLDIYAVRLGCDGSQRTAPFPVQSDTSGNDVDPEIAIAGDRLIVVWQVDDQTGGTANMQVRYRSFALDGTPMGDQAQLVTTRAGTPITENHIGVDLAVNGDRAAFGGARAVPDVLRLQAYAQPYGMASDALESPSEAEVSHRNASIAMADDGTIWIAYDREPDAGGQSVYVRSFAEPSTPAEPAIGEALFSTSSADLLFQGGHVWAAFNAMPVAVGTPDLRLVDVALPLAERMGAAIGVTGRADHMAKLAASPSGALAIAWYRNIRGITNELFVAPFTAGNPPVVGDEVLVYGSPGAAPYQPALTYVDAGYWFVAWSEGESPDLRLIGRFVALP
jgi:hypothetical protein